jgi:hypothetical protein
LAADGAGSPLSRTRSPTPHTLVSSWALQLALRRHDLAVERVLEAVFDRHHARSCPSCRSRRSPRRVLRSPCFTSGHAVLSSQSLMPHRPRTRLDAGAHARA